MESLDLSGFRAFSIPRWAKYTFFLFIIFLGALNTAIFFYGMLFLHDHFLITASIHLLSAILPILSIIYLIVLVRDGERAILKNIERLFLAIIPQALSNIEEPVTKFYEARPNAKINERASQAKVLSNYVRGQIYSDFAIFLADEPRKIMIRSEINHRRINFNLYIPASTLYRTFGLKTLSDIDNIACTEKVLERLGHSIGGAVYFREGNHAPAHESSFQTGYTFNDKMIRRTIDRQDYFCIVGMKTVSQQFIWEQPEQYYFANDLMLMLRAMADEYADIKQPLDQPVAA
jgi:hypothetical protein